MLRSRPDVLVLGGGGLLGVEWMMGVLSGIEDETGFDLRECEYFVGTSAGSIVAARLASGRSLRRPSSKPPEPAPPLPDTPEGLGAVALETARRVGEWTLAACSPFAPMALRLSKPESDRHSATSTISKPESAATRLASTAG
jgi:NTE family protein